MKKKILFILIIMLLVTGVGITYLNQVFLPIKIKSLIIRTLEEQTQKRVTLESVQFNIFKGLVLRNLSLYDETKPIISLKEGSCAFFILPLFQKKIVIPKVRLVSAVIFLERRANHTFNLKDLLVPRVGATKKNFNIFVYSLSITNSRIDFEDNALSPKFTKSMDNLNLTLSLSLPSRIKFNLASEIPANPRIKIMVSGEFRIREKQLIAKIAIKDLSPQEFSGYYESLGVSIPEGTIDALINMTLKDEILNADLEGQNNGLVLSKNKIQAKLNSDMKVNLRYSLKDKQLSYSGGANITESDISGIAFFDRVADIKGELKFNNSGLFCDRLLANSLGVPLKVKAELTDFNNPLLNINISSSLGLDSLKRILKDKFKFGLPADIQGKAKLSLEIKAALSSVEPPKINGSLDILNATAKLDKINSSIEEIAGRIEFSPLDLKWLDLHFKYSGIIYKTNGVLIDFKAPHIQLNLSSTDLSLQSKCTINDKLVNLSEFSGRYFNSNFSLTGEINTTDFSNLDANISGALEINLQDSKEILKKFKDQLEQIKPAGIINTKFTINGNINKIKSCLVQAKLSSPSISFYGLQSGEFLLDYSQIEGIADIPLIYLSLYDGTIKASAKMNLNSDNLPYWVSADIQDVKLEKLKLDTGAREKDIAGTVQAEVKINGFSGYLSKLSGAGKIIITDGRLWQLNFFKGMGRLLFIKDFANVVFSEGSCGFVIQDKSIFSDNLKLKSNLVGLSGVVKISFDSSIDATLNVEVSEDFPLTGTIKDVTTAIIGQARRFGVIKVSGTLKEPKYKFETAVTDIIKGLKDSIFRN